MFELHNTLINVELEELDKEVKQLKVTLKSINDFFINNRDKLIGCVDYNLLLNGEHQYIKTPLNAIEEYANINLIALRDTTKLINNKEARLKVIKGQKLHIKVFFYIIKRINELIVDALIYKGYQLKDDFIGTIKIINAKDKKKRPDWNKSFINKQKLIEQGKVPYMKADAEKALKENKPYNGVPWLIYHNSENSLWFNWSYGLRPALILPNIRNYVFVPLRGTSGAVAKLQEFRKSLSKDEFNERFNNPNKFKICT